MSLILANLTSAALSVPGHVYQLISPFVNERERHEDQSDDVALESPDATHSWWQWQEQGLDGLDILVSLASVLSILLISLDRYYVR